MILNALLLTCSTAILITAITLLHRARKHTNETMRLLTARITAETHTWGRHNKQQLWRLINELEQKEQHEHWPYQ